MYDFFCPGKASVIVGGQFGSEAKGMAAAVMARQYIDDDDYMICTTNAGAQAGHTTILEDGKKFVCYHLPTMGVMLPNSRIYINAGSIIDPVLLAQEIIDVGIATGEGPESLRKRITVHPNAAIIMHQHKIFEQDATSHLGSTMKGVGAALSSKVMRDPKSVAQISLPQGLVNRIEAMDMTHHLHHLNSIVTVEIPQGTGLSINADVFYPKCTSRDCWVGQGLTDAGIHPYFLHKTMMVQRTFPIRVGHVYKEGVKIGDSGPFYKDSRELNWEKDFPGIEPERTTVTKRVRRIATWSPLQYKWALSLNRPDIVMTTFTNYLDNKVQFRDMLYVMNQIANESMLEIRHIWSYGPGVNDFVTSAACVKTAEDLK